MPRFESEDLRDLPPPEAAPKRSRRPLVLLFFAAGGLLLLAVALFGARSIKSARGDREEMFAQMEMDRVRAEQAEAARARDHGDIEELVDMGPAGRRDVITAGALVEFYRTDPVRADQRYKGVRVRVEVDLEYVARGPAGPVFTSRAYADGGRERVRLVFRFRDEAFDAAKVTLGLGKTLTGVCLGKATERPAGALDADAYIVFDVTAAP